MGSGVTKLTLSKSPFKASFQIVKKKKEKSDRACTHPYVIPAVIVLCIHLFFLLHSMPFLCPTLCRVVPCFPLEAHIPVTSTESPQTTWPREGGVKGPSYIITHPHTHTNPLVATVIAMTRKVISRDDTEQGQVAWDCFAIIWPRLLCANKRENKLTAN